MLPQLDLPGPDVHIQGLAKRGTSPEEHLSPTGTENCECTVPLIAGRMFWYTPRDESLLWPPACVIIAAGWFANGSTKTADSAGSRTVVSKYTPTTLSRRNKRVVASGL